MLDNLQLIPGEAFTATGSIIEKLLIKYQMLLDGL